MLVEESEEEKSEECHSKPQDVIDIQLSTVECRLQKVNYIFRNIRNTKPSKTVEKKKLVTESAYRWQNGH